MIGFSNKQMEVLKFPYSDYEALICDGAIRAGKSVVMLVAYLTSSMANYNECKFALCSKTVKTAERNIIKTIMGITYFHTEFKMKYSIKDSCLTVTRGNKRNYFYVFGGKDESSYQLIQGITLAGAFFDEVALMPESFVNQALGRCSVEGAKFWFNCNPEDPNHWFYQQWIKKDSERRALYLHFDMIDNPSLSVETIERYERMYEGVFYQRYIKGLWVKAEGIIYRKFADNPEQYIYDKVPSDISFVNVGIDFGGSQSGTTFIATGFSGFRGITILESVRYMTKRQSPYDIEVKDLSPEKLDKLYVEFCDMVYTKYGKAFVSRADSAEQVLIRGLKNAAILSHCHTDIMNAKKTEILERIKLVLRLIGEGRFHIMRHCKTMIKALSDAVWDAKHPDRRLDDGSTDIDTMDAMEYSIEEYTQALLDTTTRVGR